MTDIDTRGATKPTTKRARDAQAHSALLTLFLEERFTEAVFDAVRPRVAFVHRIRQMDYENAHPGNDILGWFSPGEQKQAKAEWARKRQLPVTAADLPRIKTEFVSWWGGCGPADVHMHAVDVSTWSSFLQDMVVRLRIVVAMGDDFAVVLGKLKGTCCNALFLGAYTGSVPLDQVRQIFAASEITILLHADFARRCP